MIIENLELFKGWLTGCLQPLCDADPGALAKYVIALVKKDKPESELRALCLDQLEVFFQKETKPFVELLFETLNCKAYLKVPQQQAVSNQPSNQQRPSAPAVNSSTSSASNSQATVAPQAPQEKVLPETSLNGAMPVGTPKDAAISKNTSSKVIETKRTKGGLDVDDRDVKRSRPQRSKSKSRSPVGRGNTRNKPNLRDPDDRRSRRFLDDDRRRRGFSNRRYENRYREFHERRPQDGPERDRDREGRLSARKERRDNKSSAENDRSKSRSWSRSWSRSTSRSPSRSRSRSWSRIRDRNRESSRNESRSAGSTNPPSNMAGNQSGNIGPPVAPPVGGGDHGDKDYRLPGVPPPPPPNSQAPSNEGNHFRSKSARRCRDYDEKGYCMRGDLCPFDHGADPVVVEDVSVLGFPHSSNVAAPPPPPPLPHGVGPAPPPPPPGTMPPILPPIHNQPLSSVGQPSLPPEPYVPEPYNPEAPGMERVPPRMRSSFWHPGGPPSGPPPSIRPPPSHQRGPPPHIFHGGPPPRTRELIGVPTVDDIQERIESPTNSHPEMSQRTVLGPHKQPPLLPLGMAEVENGEMIPVMTPDQQQQQQQQQQQGPMQHLMGGPPQDGFGGFKRCLGGRPFDYNRLGPRKPFNPDRCILELRKVPRTLNTIASLNTHFSKFGTVVNLQVCFGGDPEAALVQFSSHSEANAAYRCTEAVLNNRFIKVFWHNKENAANNSLQPQITPLAAAAQPQSAVGPQPPAQPAQVPVSTKDIAVPLPVTTGDSALLKPSVKERLGNTANTKIHHFRKLNTTLINNVTTSAEDTTEKAVLFSSTGNLSRTVFNPSALKKSNVMPGATRKVKEDLRKETIKRKMEVQIKRQNFIQTLVKEQKVLFEKLEKCKTDKEKQQVKQMLIELSKAIEELRGDIKKDASEIVDITKTMAPTVPKSKAEAEKELLDAEMDLYNKQHCGDDTTDLKKKVFDLKQQARALGFLDSKGQLRSLRGGLTFRGRGSFVQRGSALTRRGGQHLMFRGTTGKHTSVDRRPRKILAEGATELERENLYGHFSQFAEVESIEILTNGIVFTFKNRKDAEKAMALANRLHLPQQLKTSWFRGPPSLSEDSLLEAEVNALRSVEDVGEHLDEEEDLMVDDEEEEDSEARSWRR